MTGSTSSKSYEDAVDPKVTFAIRTKAKRAHTRRANKLNHLIETVAPTTEVVVGGLRRSNRFEREVHTSRKAK